MSKSAQREGAMHHAQSFAASDMSEVCASRLSVRPLYVQVRDLLVQRIATGHWRPGSALPNEALLAREMNVSLGTVRKALEEMADEQIIFRRQGRGTFVSDHSTEEMAFRFTRIHSSSGDRIEGVVLPKRISLGSANPQECHKLELGKDQEVWRCTRVRSYRKRPFMIEESHIPANRFASMSTEQGDYRICVLAQMNGVLLRDAVETVSLDKASEEDLTEFASASPQSVLVLDRTIYAVDGKPVEWRVARCDLQDLHYVAHIS